MYSDLKDKIAIVTGGTSGIGKSIVERMSAEGTKVLFTGTNAERGASVAAATGARFFPGDAAGPDYAETLIASIASEVDGVDILISNAGSMGWAQDVENTSIEAFDHTIAVHLRTPWLLMSRVAPLMRKRGGGSIVNMASVAGHRVGASSVAYSVAKAALIHLTRCAAAEFGADRIRVNSLSPGFVATSIHAAGIEGDPARGERFVDGMARLFLSRQALPHTGQPVDIAELALFLASDVSAFVSGSDIVADGGLMWGRAGLV